MTRSTKLRPPLVGSPTPALTRFGFLYVLVLILALFPGEYITADAPSDADSSDEASEGTAGGDASKARRIPNGGVPVPSIFQVAADSLPPRPLTPPTLSSPSTHTQSPLYRGPSSLSADWTGSSSNGELMVSELLEANAFSRVGASFGDVLVLTDVDDTLWCSGSMAAFGEHIGGIDSELARGLPYPAIGTLLFFLAMGPHTSTPSGLRIPLQHCPVPLVSPQTHNCPVEVHGVPVLPRSPGVVSARVSTSVFATLTRPRSFYSDIEAILTGGARHVYGTTVSRWSLGYQNTMRMMQLLSSQHSRGAAKIWGFAEALDQGAHAVVIGDTGQKDPEAAAGMAVKHPEGVAAVLLHSVFVDRQKELEAAADPTQNELPPHAIPFVINVGGIQVPAVQLVYEVVARVKQGEKSVNSPSDLSGEMAYAVGVQIAADMRQIFSAATRKHLLSVNARTQGDLSSQPVAPALVFMHVAQLQAQTVEATGQSGVASQLAHMSSKLAMKVTRWSSKRFSSNRVLAERAAFRQQALAEPVTLRAPLQFITPMGIRYPLGVPFASYRTVVGAGLASWVLGMMPVQDLVSLVVAAVRDLRSLGPPTHCWQRAVVQEMLADIMSMEHYVGPLETRTDLQGTSLYADAIGSLRAFEAFHQEHCGQQENTVTPLNSCLEAMESSLALHAAEGAYGSVQQLFPIMNLVCRYKPQMDHWPSAGSEEVESLSFLLGRAVILGMSAASFLNSQRGKRDSIDAGRAGQQHNQVPKEQKNQQTTSGISGETALRKLQRDLALLPELAVDLHVSPEDPSTQLSQSLQLNALDMQTLEDLKPFMPEDNVPPFSIDAPTGLQYLGKTADTNGTSKGNSRSREDEESKFHSDSCIYHSVGPMTTWAENLHSFCKKQRNTVAADVCNTLRRWLKEVAGLPGPDGQASTGALPALVKVAEWNTQRPKGPLQISDLGIVLEPLHMRPGVTGRGELEKAYTLDVVGGISSGKKTIRYQRPSERAVWQRVFWVLKALTEMECDPFRG